MGTRKARRLKSPETLLEALAVDDKSIRFDGNAQWLERKLPDWSVCGVHLATETEVSELGFMENAIVPDIPLPLSARHFDRFRPFLADTDTIPGLCLGLGRLDEDSAVVADILSEAERPDFQPHQGSYYDLKPFKGRLLGVLTAQPGARTTTVIDPRLQQYSESRKGVWVGMHYDNSLNSAGEGERLPVGLRAAQSERRIILNTGPGTRRLVLALGMSALHLSELVSPGDAKHIPTSRHLQQYLLGRPDAVERITCIVIPLEPREYVVFPAGIALHDGSMHGATQPSVAIVLAGRFPRWTELF